MLNLFAELNRLSTEIDALLRRGRELAQEIEQKLEEGKWIELHAPGRLLQWMEQLEELRGLSQNVRIELDGKMARLNEINRRLDQQYPDRSS